MGAKQERETVTQAAIDGSRNQRQKSVLLVEVARSVCAATDRLIGRSKRLMDDAATLRQQSKVTLKRRPKGK